jgi:RNA polymerase primary sigma factor
VADRKASQRTAGAAARTKQADTAGLTYDPVKDYLAQIGVVPLLDAAQEVDLARRIEAGMMAQHVLDTSDGLTDDQRRDLELIAADGRACKEHFLAANLRLVVSVARRYKVPTMPMLDLVQEGNLGLIKAVEKFDYARGNRFSTHAIWWIRQAITRSLSEQSRLIRIPAHVAEQITKLRRATRLLETDLEREPTPEELAAELDLTPERVVQLQRYDRDPVPLDAPVGDGEATELFELVLETDAIEPVDIVAFHALQEALESLLSSLDEREADIVRRRFGLWDGRLWKLGEVAELYGLTRERIRQIEAKALGKLRHPSRAQKLEDFAA